MRQMVFEIVDGRAMPRLPRKPGGSFLSLEQAAVATGHTVAALRQQYDDTYGGILEQGQVMPGRVGADDAADGESVIPTMARPSGVAGESSAVADARLATGQPSPSTGPATDTDGPSPAGSGALPFDEMKLALAHALHFPNLTEEQFARVQHFAAARGFNLLSRQLWAEVRWDDRVKAERLFIGLTIEGMRAEAHRTGQYAGSDAKNFTLNEDGLPISAIATVYRLVGGKRQAFTGEAEAAELMTAPGDGDVLSFRKQAPKTWLGKCAQAAALRDAFPDELGGIYTPEEMIRSLRQMRSRDAQAASTEERNQREDETFAKAADFIEQARARKAGPTAVEERRDEDRTEVTSRRTFDLALMDLEILSPSRREQILKLARLRLPDLAKLDDDAAFYTMAWQDVTLYPHIYGLKQGPARVAG